MIVFIPWLGEAPAAPAAHQVARSLRFSSADSPYLSRTPGSAGNRKTLAMRFRIKRAKLGALQVIASAGTSSIDRFYFDSSDRLCLDVLGTARLVTTARFRDPTAWMDVGFELDVGNATAASRAKILVFESEVLAYSTNGRSSIADTNTNWNNSVAHYLGRDNSGNYFDGYVGEPCGADGSTAITYSAVDGATGVRLPVLPSATWGTNGFWLPLADNSAADATHLGADSSGNGNQWTPYNVSVAAGSGNDSLTDSPTSYGTDTGAGGEMRGNYPVMNRLYGNDDVFADANLKLTTSLSYGGRPNTAATAKIPSSGKWYFEFKQTDDNGDSNSDRRYFGMVSDPYSGLSGTYSFVYRSDGTKDVDGANTAYGATWAIGDVIGFAINVDDGAVTCFKNGTSQGTVSYANSAGEFPVIWDGRGTYTLTAEVNFGQRPFAHAAPAGFKTLCTANLPDTTIITSGSFEGNADADGPFVWLDGVPETLTINGNAVTWGTHADKLANGFKVRTTSSSYNVAGTNTFSVTSTGTAFKYARAQVN